MIHAILFAASLLSSPPGGLDLRCEPLRVRVMTAGPALRVQKVHDARASVRVRLVEWAPRRPGEWQVVTQNEDLRIRWVSQNPDLRVRIVDSRCGCS